MLNELIIIERGAHQAGIKLDQRHPDVKDAGGKLTLLVQLDKKGHVASVSPLPSQVTPWTLRDGQHNSFPFVQTNRPFYKLDGGDDKWREDFFKIRNINDQRQKLLSLSGNAQYQIDDWPNKGLLQRLRERWPQLAGLKKTEANIARTVILRFLRACRSKENQLLQEVTDILISNLRLNAQQEWLKVATALLVGKKDKNRWVNNGALLFEAEGSALSIADPKLIVLVSQSLTNFSKTHTKSKDGQELKCGLTGRSGRFEKFHQPNLPVIGQTFLFAKNDQIPANDRYGRFSSEAMPVIQETVDRLDAAIRNLITDDRENKTWRAVPGEAPKQNDLFLAFVENVPDVAICESLIEEDFSEESHDSRQDRVNSVAAFEKRTERVIDLVKAKVGNDVTKTPVQLVIFRKLDQSNRKVVYADTLTVTGLYKAAKEWKTGEENVPSWLTLPILLKGESNPQSLAPPHIAPLGLIVFSKQIFLRNGERPHGKKKEQVGLSVSEVLRFFINSATNGNLSARSRVGRILRMSLSRRSMLVEKVGHIQHTPECWERRSKEFKKFDRWEALRTLTLLGILLHKLNRKKEVYMNDTAFKLGQLLAGVDIVHAGYCADVRGGAVPPALLGNQVFSMAQTAPVKALATLCQRWKPYDGWAKKAAREETRIEKMISSGDKTEQKRGGDIRNAIDYAGQICPLANELGSVLENCRIDDAFRAELLLGYIAGLPK